MKELSSQGRPGSDVGGRDGRMYVSCASIPCTWIAIYSYNIQYLMLAVISYGGMVIGSGNVAIN